MKTLSVLVLCVALFACTKEPDFRAIEIAPSSQPEPSIVNHLPLTTGDTLLVEAIVHESPQENNSRWSVEVYMSRVVDQDVQVTVEWNGPLGSSALTVILYAGQREERSYTNFDTPPGSTSELVKVTSVLCTNAQWKFMY